MRSDCSPHPPQIYFHCATGFAAQRLAHVVDSLVRVSRRVSGRLAHGVGRGLVVCASYVMDINCMLHAAHNHTHNRPTHTPKKLPRPHPRSAARHTSKCRKSTPSNASRAPPKPRRVARANTTGQLTPPMKSARAPKRQPLPPQQFHVLFHSLFKVLFIFPSQYLFAIGLVLIFSFG